MDNQEAIKWLREAEILDLASGNTKDREAVNMAISALQAQEAKTQLSREDTTLGVQKTCVTCKHYPESKWPCIDCDMRNPANRWEPQELSKNSQKLDSGNGDCISRAAAMTAIQMIAERYTLAHEKMGDGRVEWSEYLVRMSDAFDVIRDLQSVEPYQEEIEIMTYPQVPGITPTVI